jgi:uncharacterized protein (DUF1499 family)
MKTVVTGLAWLGVLIAVAAVAFVVVGPVRVWGLFGDPDLGPVTFEQLRRRTTANDALVCPQDLCTAKVDIVSPRYPVASGALRAAFAKVIASEERVILVQSEAAPALSDRYIQRTKLMGFPDTIVVRFVDRPDGQSTVALYSRSQLGESDLGANRHRLQRWLDKLSRQVKPVG